MKRAALLSAFLFVGCHHAPTRHERLLAAAHARPDAGCFAAPATSQEAPALAWLVTQLTARYATRSYGFHRGVPRSFYSRTSSAAAPARITYEGAGQARAALCTDGRGVAFVDRTLAECADGGVDAGYCGPLGELTLLSALPDTWGDTGEDDAGMPLRAWYCEGGSCVPPVIADPWDEAGEDAGYDAYAPNVLVMAPDDAGDAP